MKNRNWIFRPELTSPLPLPPPPQPTSLSSNQVPAAETAAAYSLPITLTPVTLFRFSALTFNAHKIHYNREWCRTIEGHRDLVVHGPLNLILIVDFWRSIYGGKYAVKKVSYRATNPLYVGEEYKILMDEETDGVSEVRIVDLWGKTGMRARIERF